MKSDKSLKSFPPCYSPTALPWDFYFFKLTQPVTVSRGHLMYTFKEKGGKPDRKSYPLPYGLRNPYRNHRSENSQDYVQKPQQNCAFMTYASGIDSKKPVDTTSLLYLSYWPARLHRLAEPISWTSFLCSLKV
jgi:hypothetical protein